MPRRLAGSNYDIALGLRIRAARSTAGMSMDALGKAVGLAYQQIQKYEKGQAHVDCEMLILLASVLHVKACDLLTGGRGDGGVTLEIPSSLVAIETGRYVDQIPDYRNQDAVRRIALAFVEAAKAVQPPEKV